MLEYKIYWQCAIKIDYELFIIMTNDGVMLYVMGNILHISLQYVRT